MITIVDSGGANIASIQFGLQRLGVEAMLSHDANVIRKSSHIILPGVGSAERAMRILKQYSLVEIIRSLTQPVLGICLGMQVLFESSQEGDIECLGIIKAKITKISNGHKSREIIVPHMGWNTLNIIDKNSLMKNVPNHSYVYFVHSYAAPIDTYTLAIMHHGKNFSAAVQKNNFYGLQFHPERSSVIGSTILKNFLEL